MRKTGTIIAIPVRIPQVSAIHPMNGSINSPGSSQSEAIENPIERERGGMASDSEARIPGPTIARHRAIITFAPIATARLGTTANTSESADVIAATTARNAG